MRRILLALLCIPVLTTSACRTPYYWAMDKLGIQKREILVDRVQEGRDAQNEAKEQFQSALEAFRMVHDVDGGDLEEIYERLNDEYEDSLDRAEEVRSRIGSIETVAGDLFTEWQDELSVMANPELKRQSQQMLKDTQSRYGELLGAMNKAESSMQPVLDAFRDHVFALKHNLNAQAIASLSGELRSIETDIGSLIADMESSIAEADAFLDTLN